MYAVMLVYIALWQGIFANEPEYVDAVYGGVANLMCEIPPNTLCNRIVWAYWGTNLGFQYISSCTYIYSHTTSGLTLSDRNRFNLTIHSSTTTLRIRRVTQQDIDYTYNCRFGSQVNKEFKIRVHTPDCTSSVIDKWATMYVSAPVPTDMTVSSNKNDLPVSNVKPHSTTMEYKTEKALEEGNSAKIETSGDTYVTVHTFFIAIGLCSTLPVILVVAGVLGCYWWKRKTRKRKASKARPIEKPYTELDLSDVRRRDDETYMGLSPTSSPIYSQPYESIAKEHGGEGVITCTANMETADE
ncbi:uncharacterized protein [Amphiura filiformis]|uniref:uncharacterized protein n=1 Tax=Amphiura filiformis TaxID=82378 RepID=UPI003B216920